MAEKSGLNQWNGVRSCYKKDKETGERIKVKETPRDVNELYIPYPSIDRNRDLSFHLEIRLLNLDCQMESGSALKYASRMGKQL